jgi:hypothetical protein
MLPFMKWIHCILSIRLRSQDRETIVLRDLELDLHTLTVVTQVTVTISRTSTIVRELALVVRTMRGFRHCLDALDCFSRNVLLSFIEPTDQGLKVGCSDYMLRIRVLGLPP